MGLYLTVINALLIDSANRVAQPFEILLCVFIDVCFFVAKFAVFATCAKPLQAFLLS